MRVCTRTGQQHHRNHISHHHHHPAQAHRAVRALQQTQAARRQRRSGPLARAQRSYATGAATASACRARAAAPHLEHDLELIATATQWHRITAVERAADSTDQAAADTHGTKHTRKNAADARQHTLTLIARRAARRSMLATPVVAPKRAAGRGDPRHPCAQPGGVVRAGTMHGVRPRTQPAALQRAAPRRNAKQPAFRTMVYLWES